MIAACGDLAIGSILSSWRGRKPVVAVRRERVYRVSNAVYHHDLAPNVSTDSAMWGPIHYRVRTNAFGFKDARVREVPLVDSLRRTLFIGDSFTEGVGIPYESTFVGIIGERMASSHRSVLNAAVASYSPAIYWRKLAYLIEERGLRVDAVVVFLDASDIADEATQYRISADGRIIDIPRPNRGWWQNHSLLYRIARRMSRLARPGAFVIGCGRADAENDECRAGWTTSRVIMRDWGSEGLARADTNMKRVAALLARHGIPLTVAVYPWPQHLRLGDRNSLHRSFWKSWAAREHVKFVDLFEPFFAAADERGSDEVIDSLYVHGDVHWNAAGHQFVADQFLAHLR